MDRIRLVALDIDGTLLDPQGRVRDPVREQVARVHAKGIPVVLITGRRFESALPCAQQLSVPVLLGLHNGAVLREVGGRTLALWPIDQKAVAQTVALGREIGAIIWAYRAGAFTEIYSDPPDDLSAPLRAVAARYIAQNRSAVAWLDEKRLPEGSWLEVRLAVSRQENLDLMQAIQKRLNAPARTIPESARGPIAYFGVVAQDVSKARPLQFLCNRLGVDPADVLAIGDNLNDREMLTFVGHPFVMANAHPQLRKLGFPTAPSNAEDGVAAVLAQL